MEQALRMRSLDIVEQPAFPKSDLLECILPVEAAKPYAERNPEEKAACGNWFGFMDWVACLKRAEFPVAFEGGTGSGEAPPAKKRKLPAFVGR